MANIRFRKTNDESQYPIQDNQIIFMTDDSGRIFVDDGNIRRAVGGASTGDGIPLSDYSVPSSLQVVTDEDSIVLALGKTDYRAIVANQNVFNVQENLLPHPFETVIQSINGLTITDVHDGTLTFNGTATAVTTIVLATKSTLKENFPLEHGRTYSMNGCPNISGCQLRVRYNDGNQNVSDTGSGVTFKYMESSNETQIQIVIQSGTTLNNVTFSPMLIRGYAQPSVYKRYSDSASNLKESIYNPYENLLPFPYAQATSALYNGLTFTQLKDGRVSVNGTATADVSYKLNTFVFKGGVVYTLVGCPSIVGCSITVTNRTFSDVGKGVNVIFDNNTTTDIWITIRNGVVLNNVTFSPMVLEGDFQGINAYAPYTRRHPILCSPEVYSTLPHDKNGMYIMA